MKQLAYLPIWVVVVVIAILVFHQNLLGESHHLTVIALLVVLFAWAWGLRRRQTHADGEAAESTPVLGLVAKISRLTSGEESIVDPVRLAVLIELTDRAMLSARVDQTITTMRRLRLLPALGDLKIALARIHTTGVIDHHAGAEVLAAVEAKKHLRTLRGMSA